MSLNVPGGVQTPPFLDPRMLVILFDYGGMEHLSILTW